MIFAFVAGPEKRDPVETLRAMGTGGSGYKFATNDGSQQLWSLKKEPVE